MTEPQRGSGELVFERAGAVTVLHAARARSPLRLLTPRNHGHAAWVFAATFGGGLVDGDAIGLDLTLAAGATGLLGTQASTKVYRCPRDTCRQTSRRRSGPRRSWSSCPIRSCALPTRATSESLAVDLAGEASLLLVDTFTAGRSARGERWQFARYASQIRVTRAGAPVVHDVSILDPAHGAVAARLGRFDAIATVLLVGPRVAALRQAALERKSTPARAAALVEAVSPIGDDGVLIRVAGVAVEAVTSATRGYLAGLATLLGDDPFARKW